MLPDADADVKEFEVVVRATTAAGLSVAAEQGCQGNRAATNQGREIISRGQLRVGRVR